MDANNPVQPTPEGSVATPTPVQTPVMPQVPISNPSSSNKIVLWFVGGLVLVVLIVGGIYLFLSRQQAVVPTKTQQPITQAPTPTPQENLEGDLNSVNLDTGTPGDFTSVDQDIQQL